MSLILTRFFWVVMIPAIRDDAVVNRRYLTTHLLCLLQVKIPALLGEAP